MEEGQTTMNKYTTEKTKDWSWKFWFTVPIYPYSKRRTIRTEVVKDTIWTFDQLQGIFYVVVPIRMSVIRLQEGGLLVYAPVAPTPECIRLVQELVAKYGDVKYIILPTISGIEHKVFVGPFARKFPQAQVFVAPNQWSYPLNLPLSWLGYPLNRTHILPEDSTQTPFAQEFDYAILSTIDLNLGKFGEVAFYHRQSRTLLVTDTIVSIPETPPAIVQLDPFPLLFHAKDYPWDSIVDNQANRRKGWQRISLFAFYFRPSTLETTPLVPSIRDAFKAPNHSRRNYFGLFPFRWQDSWEQSFATLHGGGRLFVAPILQTLILNRAPQATLNWVEKVAKWDFGRIIPCHFNSPIEADREQFRQAFSFLQQSVSLTSSLPEVDFALLKDIDNALVQRGLVPPGKS